MIAAIAALAIAAGGEGAGYRGTSTSSNSANNSVVGTTLTWTTQAGLAYAVGSRVRAAFTSDPTQYVEGLVTIYSGTTISIAVDRTGSDSEETLNSWNFTIAGDPGSTWFRGSGAPASSLGNNGDFYIDTASSELTVYTKSGGTWS